MSRNVWLECLDCGSDEHREQSGRINHGEDRLREMWRARKELIALDATHTFDLSEIRDSCCGHIYETKNFICAHGTHQVVLMDEYGGTASPDAPGLCKRIRLDLQMNGNWHLDTDDMALTIRMLREVLATTEVRPQARRIWLHDGQIHFS